MKNLTYFKILICTCILSFGLTACKKFSILKSEDQEAIPAGANLKNLTIWEYLQQDNFHENDVTGLGLYGKAVAHAGLKDLLNGQGSFTVIIPNATAMLSLVKSMGYLTVEEVPPMVLKNILSSTIIQTPVRSFDLGIAETKSFVTLNNDSLYLSRSTSTSDQYILKINASPLLSSPSPTVRSQNLEFKNGVAHVVTAYTYYLPKTKAKDAIDPKNVHIDTDTIFVSKDAMMTAGTSANITYGTTTYLEAKTAAINFTKRSILQFPLKRPSFTGRVGSVEVGVYFTVVDATGGPLSFYEDENKDWIENTITWNNAPAPGSVPLSTTEALTTAGLNKWYYGAITSTYLNALNSNKTFINIGLNSAGANRLRVTSREGNKKQAPFIVIKSGAETILKNPTNTGISVDASGIKTITPAELKMEGTTANNITYTITALPKDGYLVISGIPAQIGSFFTQEQIEIGIIKYLHYGSQKTDGFSVEVNDFQNGFYNDILTVKVTIQ